MEKWSYNRFLLKLYKVYKKTVPEQFIIAFPPQNDLIVLKCDISIFSLFSTCYTFLPIVAAVQ